MDWWGLLSSIFHYLSSAVGYVDTTLQSSQILEHLGVITAAITGVLAAGNKKIDFFGILILGFVTAVGGGTVRDLCLNVPVWWIEDSSFIVSVIITCSLTFCIARLTRIPRVALDILDAFSLALFTVVGSWKALQIGTDHLDSIMMGVITGVAGGILRDVLLMTIPKIFQAGIYLYATASTCGALSFVVMYRYNIPYRWAIAVLIILVLRLCAIKWKVSLPIYYETNNNDIQNPS